MVSHHEYVVDLYRITISVRTQVILQDIIVLSFSILLQILEKNLNIGQKYFLPNYFM
jgi:hypothetical protein